MPPIFLFYLFKDFIYLFTIDIERERGRDRQREKQASRKEPVAGLDPGSPGSRPGPKAGAKPLRHPGIPEQMEFKVKNIIFTLATFPK